MKKEATMRDHLQTLVRMTLIAAAICLFGGAVFAQEITGSIAGSVTDANGAGVSGATVTFTDVDKKTVVRTATTKEQGDYSVPLLPVGTYDITVEAKNFKKHVESGVKLDVNQRRTIDVTLEAGRIEEVV